jgi:hypothetical protein
VREVVESLIKRGHLNTSEDAGMKVVAQALTEDWIVLAHEMVDALSPEDKTKLGF